MTLKWHGDKVNAELLRKAREGVKKVCLLVETIAKESMKRGGRTESGAVAYGAYSLKTRRGLASTAYDPVTGKKGLSKIGTYRSSGEGAGEPPRTQEGHLKGSITSEMEPGLPIGRVGTNLAYGRYLEFGIPGGKRIVPKSAKVLAWVGPDGVSHFAKVVIQGAIRPRPWLRPAVHQVEGQVTDVFSKVL